MLHKGGHLRQLVLCLAFETLIVFRFTTGAPLLEGPGQFLSSSSIESTGHSISGMESSNLNVNNLNNQNKDQNNNLIGSLANSNLLTNGNSNPGLTANLDMIPVYTFTRARSAWRPTSEFRSRVPTLLFSRPSVNLFLRSKYKGKARRDTKTTDAFKQYFLGVRG